MFFTTTAGNSGGGAEALATEDAAGGAALASVGGVDADAELEGPAEDEPADVAGEPAEVGVALAAPDGAALRGEALSPPQAASDESNPRSGRAEVGVRMARRLYTAR
jgi:hypothetical protein